MTSCPHAFDEPTTVSSVKKYNLGRQLDSGRTHTRTEKLSQQDMPQSKHLHGCTLNRKYKYR